MHKHRQRLETMYTDKVTVFRHQKIKKPNGETKLEPVPVYENQPCRISQKALAVNGQTEAHNQIAYETKLFLAPELEIKQGDKLEVTRGSTVRSYTAGEPFLYPTHQEVILQRKDKA